MILLCILSTENVRKDILVEH